MSLKKELQLKLLYIYFFIIIYLRLNETRIAIKCITNKTRIAIKCINNKTRIAIEMRISIKIMHKTWNENSD